MPSCPSTPREPPNLHNFQRGLRFGSDFCLSIFAGSKKNAPIFVILRVDFSRENHKGCLLCFGSETSKEWLKESWDLRHRRIWETNWTILIVLHDNPVTFKMLHLRILRSYGGGERNINFIQGPTGNSCCKGRNLHFLYILWSLNVQVTSNIP